MSLDDRDVRPGMDVYTLDNHYLGTVARVEAGFSGESLGPMPTAPLGNRGPTEQSAARRYATVGGRVGHPLGGGRILVRRWLVGLDPRTLWPRARWLPLDLVQTVSLERVVLGLTRAQLGD